MLIIELIITMNIYVVKLTFGTIKVELNSFIIIWYKCHRYNRVWLYVKCFEVIYLPLIGSWNEKSVTVRPRFRSFGQGHGLCSKDNAGNLLDSVLEPQNCRLATLGWKRDDHVHVLKTLCLNRLIKYDEARRFLHKSQNIGPRDSKNKIQRIVPIQLIEKLSLQTALATWEG